MMVSVDKRTSALPTILDARHFAINYLSSAQRELVDIFGGKSDLKGPDRFTTAAWDRLRDRRADAIRGRRGYRL